MSSDLEILGTRPRGRPTLYDAAHAGRVLELAAEGCSKAEIAAALCVSQKTLDAWGRVHSEFREAMRRAKDLELAWWLKTGRQGQFEKNWNAASWAMQMRTRFKKRFDDRVPTQPSATPAKDGLNAKRTREDMERKLSRIADAGAEADVPGESLGAGA
jgi:hypothetical protein